MLFHVLVLVYTAQVGWPLSGFAQQAAPAALSYVDAADALATDPVDGIDGHFCDDDDGGVGADEDDRGQASGGAADADASVDVDADADIGDPVGGWPRAVDEASDPVDINTASAVVLAGLPMLGPRDAQAIVAGRPYDRLQALVTRRILDAERFDALAPLLYASSRPSAWVSQAQSRTWWRHDQPVATGLSASSMRGGWRLGAAMATQPPAWQPMGALVPDSTQLRDAFVHLTAGAHTWVLGYYDMGFADRMIFDTTARAAPDGLVRGAAVVAGRSHRLLGGAYSWQQRPAQARGLSATAFAATHATFHRVGGAHIAYAWDARNQLGATGYAALGDVATHTPARGRPSVMRALAAPPQGQQAMAMATGAAGAAARIGLGPCDAASEGALVMASGALGYSLAGACDLPRGLTLGAIWRDADADFDHPFARPERGRALSHRRMAGLWARMHAPWGQATGRLEVAWPRVCQSGATPKHATACFARTFSARQEARLVLHPRHALSLQARTWRGRAKQDHAPWQHVAALTWRYGGRRGWAGALGAGWQRHPASVRPAHVTAVARVGWRIPTLSLGAYGLSGVDAAHWRTGAWLAHRLSKTSTLSFRIHLGQAGSTQPLRHATLLVAKVAF